MYTWERPRKTESLSKIVETLTLNTIFSSRQKRMLRVVVWDFKREKGNSHGDGKANILVNKCLLGQAETVGHRVGSDL